MQSIFSRKLKVDASLTDINAEMGLVSALTVAQDNMCEQFKLLGCDGITMIPVANCFFVLTKSKIKFNRGIKWLDEFLATTEFTQKSKIRVEIQTTLKDDKGVFAICEQQMCPIDATSRSIRSVDSTLMPVDLETSAVSTMQFEKMSFELDDSDYFCSITITAGNLDFYKHTNNLQYVHFMYSSLGLEFAENNFIEDFEIHYIKETKLGDNLQLYKKIEGGRVLFEIKNESVIIAKAILNYVVK